MVIADNETGEIISEHDFDAIVGAVHIAEGVAHGLSILRGSIMTMAATIKAAETTIAHTEEQNPFLAFARCMVDTEIAKEENNEEEKGEE